MKRQVQLLPLLLEMRRRTGWNRAQILAAQEQQLRSLLQYVWDRSPFYRDLYRSCGIAAKDLAHIPLSALPFTSKELLMEHFDEVVAHKRLKKHVLEQWIETHPDARETFADEFVVLHTSGSSGVLGIFVYDQHAWNTVTASLAVRVSAPSFLPWQKTRLAYYAATHGRFSGVSIVTGAPRLFYDVQLYSLLTPLIETLDRLDHFQPTQISGYASTVTQLAGFQAAGKLHLSPRRLIVSGDSLTEHMEERIRAVWDIPIIELYSASEASAMAARLPGQKEMTVFDDLQVVEILDEHRREVPAGASGSVVLTNLYNRALPMIRYQMHDLAIRGGTAARSPFSCIEKILGRVNDALPIRLNGGSSDSLHPIVLSEFFVPGLEKIQFVATRPGEVILRYLSNEQLDQPIVETFQKLLRAKGAQDATRVAVEKVDSLPNDAGTGKFRLVALEPSMWSHAQSHDTVPSPL